MANASKLLHTTTDPENYVANLRPADERLRYARTRIRAYLREAFEASSAAVFGRPIRPRFFTQGSFAYKTLNDPAHPPGQQMDLDDGCYLPLSFVRGARPSTAAEKFFEFVGAALRELARIEGWRYEEKPTCCRLVIAADSHVDNPLYAIPDAEFLTLEDRRTRATTASADVAKADTWEELPSDEVLLAHREEGWIESDPRKIHNWFTDAVDVYGERLRRDSRYLKAWRDNGKLDRYKVTSILLMACAWQAYGKIGGLNLSNREDERLLRVVELVPEYVRGRVSNPACEDEDLNRIPDEHREEVAGAFEDLAALMRRVVNSCEDAREAVRLLRHAFGDRVPDRPDLVSIESAAVTGLAAPAIARTAAATVAAQPKKVVAAPEVGRSRSG
ncbi:CBASS cGAMP synthase [Aurantimonas sp. E1-2-R+4]|uniref:CBASS cGAMP synthase n=1 Tax=Aurantimonas sp. E1-2-R+4 TaxID=3113714 RepID=UPI002F91DD76